VTNRQYQTASFDFQRVGVGEFDFHLRDPLVFWRIRVRLITKKENDWKNNITGFGIITHYCVRSGL